MKVAVRKRWYLLIGYAQITQIKKHNYGVINVGPSFAVVVSMRIMRSITVRIVCKRRSLKKLV